nr:hypothetical protein [Tanacetum cinerariifolium]
MEGLTEKSQGRYWICAKTGDNACTGVGGKGHRQEEAIYYDEVFAHVARIEAIRIFLAFASYMGFIVYQIDVKSAFLYGIIDEEVYVSQPPVFVDPKFPNKVYKDKKDIMLVQVYVDDIIFGSTKKSCVKTTSTLIETQKPLVEDEEAVDVDVHLYRFQVTPKTSHLQAVKRIFRKSTTGGCQFLGRRLISWQCKKQTIVATSTTEAEYVAGAHCCGQVLWIHNQLLDYGFNSMNTKIYIDNESTICIVKNPVFHSKTKHIKIRHHFIKDAYEKNLIQVLKIYTDDNVVDLLTKAFDVSQFKFLMGYDCYGDYLGFILFFGMKIEGYKCQIHAKVVGKPVVITEASIRGDLLFNDVDGIDCKITPLFPSMLTQEAVAEGEDLGTPTESQLTPSPTQPNVRVQPPLTESSSDHDSSQDPRVDLEGTSRSGGDQVNLPHNSPLSGGRTSDRAESSLNLEALYALCANLSNMVLALETVKDAQAKEILTLKARIKKLEKRCKPSISHHRAWLMSVSLLSKKKKLNLEYIDTEEALNEGRQSTVSTARPDVSTARPDVSTARPDDDTARQELSTARQELSIAGPTTTPITSTIFDDEEMTLADTLIKLKDDKAKGVAFKDSESIDRPTRSILTLKPLPTIDPKERRKGVLEEPESAKKMTKSDFDAVQIAIDEEIARQLEVELQAEVERERQREEQASMDYIANLYDEVQARIYADHELAVRWTHKEQEKYTVDERAKLMMTYLKNIGKITHSQLNKKSFEDIQGLYLKEQELIVDFVPIGSEEDERMIRDINKKAEDESSDKGVDITKKRKKGSRMKMMSKRQKTDVDLEEEEKLKFFLKINPDEEGVIDYEVLDKRFPIIIWESKFYYYDRHGAEGIYYRNFRSDGRPRWIKTFSEMVTRFDRLHLVELYNLVMQRFESTTPEGVDLILWGDLRTMFEANTEDELWLIAESASDAAYDLLRFIQKQIDKSEGHDRGKKDL